MHILDADPGFQTEKLLTASTFLAEERYSDPERQSLFVDRLLEGVSRLPGVEAAGAAARLPLCGPFGSAAFQIAGRNHAPGSEPTEHYQISSSDYFTTLGVGLRSGRFFQPADRAESPKVVIVNQTLASKYWPGEQAVRRQLHAFGQWRLVVGVVEDLSQDGPGLPPRPEIFLPYSQHPSSTVHLVIRTSRDATGLERLVREEIRALDPGQPLSPLRTMESVLADRLIPRRLTLVLMAVFGGMAFALSMAGLYGVVDNAVQVRKREMGIRLALGARPGRLLLSTMALPARHTCDQSIS
jgi:putative ABC transport system permease protein